MQQASDGPPPVWWCASDVVKTRIQLDPVKYNKGMVDGFKCVTATLEYAHILITTTPRTH